jgi:murein tripeptide amidase MpaA
MVVISHLFDSGSIEVVDASDPADVQLRLVPEPHSDLEDETFMQWFHFRVSNAKGVPLTFRVLNAGEAAYPAGWDGYRTAITYDKQTWGRVADTSWDEAAGVLRFSLTPTHDTCWLSYFAPFSTERYMEMVARSAASPSAMLTVLGDSLDGRPIEELTIGGGRAQIWIVCQQHPGEHMASWWVEGLLARLLDPADPVSHKLLEQCTFHVVPRINPDGCARGHLRTNAAGANLNREWCPSQKPSGEDYDAPTLSMSPEVYWVLKAMDASGVDCCIDAHGDEGLPYNFFAGNRRSQLYQIFQAALVAASPDFQDVYGYHRAPGDPPPTPILPGAEQPRRPGLPRGCTAQVAQRFDCLAVTLEMPFKDCANNPMPAEGWSPPRCSKFGAAMLDAVRAVVPILRPEWSVAPKL